MKKVSIFLMSLIAFLEINDLFAQDFLDLFDTYLKQYEFFSDIRDSEQYLSFFNNNYISDKSLLPSYAKNLNFFYPAAIISDEKYNALLDDFLKTYIDVPNDQEYVQKIEIPQDSQVYFMGDLHGSIHALVRMLCKLMSAGILDANLKIIRENTYLIFLGDYIDYGCYGADTLALMMYLRVGNPNQVFACCGNHEDNTIYIQKNHGFWNELTARYSQNAGFFKQKIDKAFKSLPLAIFLGIKGQPSAGYIQCCHGGLETDLDNQKTIKNFITSSDEKYAPLKPDNKRSNLKWGDFTGINFLNNAGCEYDPTRSIKFNVSGINQYIQNSEQSVLTMNCIDKIMNAVNGKIEKKTEKKSLPIVGMNNLIKYIFRGHQDFSHACKNLIKGIDNPVCLFPLEIEEKLALQKKPSVQDWISQKNLTLETLATDGFKLNELPEEIGPVFTFTNASASKKNYDEGFGQLSVAQTWQDSIVRFHIYRPEFFKQRLALFNPDNFNSEFTFSDQYHVDSKFAPTILQALFCYLPSNTYIDEAGNSTIGIYKEKVIIPFDSKISSTEQNPNQNSLDVKQDYLFTASAYITDILTTCAQRYAQYIIQQKAKDSIQKRAQQYAINVLLDSTSYNEQDIRNCLSNIECNVTDTILLQNQYNQFFYQSYQSLNQKYFEQFFQKAFGEYALFVNTWIDKNSFVGDLVGLSQEFKASMRPIENEVIKTHDDDDDNDDDDNDDDDNDDDAESTAYDDDDNEKTTKKRKLF